MHSRQRDTHPKERCVRHGLVAIRNGACLLCLQEGKRTGAGRPVLVALAALLVSAAAIPLWRSHSNLSTRAAAPEKSPHAESRESKAIVNIPVAAARNHRAISNSNAARDSAEPADTPVTAEDHYLGAAPVTIPQSAPLAPAPPRAVVDPEPARPDNPADFELPDRAASPPPTLLNRGY